MADTKVSALTPINSLTGDDLFLIVNNPAGAPESRSITAGNIFANVSISTTHNSTVTFNSNTTFANNVVFPSSTPSTSNAFIEGYPAGALWYDDNYMYCATDQFTIKRVLLTTF